MSRGRRTRQVSSHRRGRRFLGAEVYWDGGLEAIAKQRRYGLASQSLEDIRACLGSSRILAPF